MKILITGGAGYIGTELSRALISDDRISEVVIYDNLSRANYNLFLQSGVLSPKTSFVQGELLDSRTLKRALQDVDTVVHCAARVISPFSDQLSHSFEQVNHWGTAELVYALEESGSPHLIHLSSSSVYGSHDSPVGVGDHTNPKTFYGISKKRSESHVERYMDSRKGHIIRCGNVYGFSPSMRFDTVINRMTFDAHFKKKISIHGSGEQFRAFVHIDTVSSFLHTLIHSDLDVGTYDLVESNLSVNTIAAQLKEVIPDMEMLFIDQNMKMREVQVRKDERISHLVPREEIDLAEDLASLRAHFSF